MRRPRLDRAPLRGQGFILGVLCSCLLAMGCEQQGYSVVAATGTNIGLDIGVDPASQTPSLKLGYQRGEFAFVPTNRPATTTNQGDKTSGAQDTAEVLMELRYGGSVGTTTDTGIYQRLAVGPVAVKQSVEALLFTRKPDGSVDKNAAAAIQQARIAAASLIEQEDAQISAIVTCVSNADGNVDPSKLSNLVDQIIENGKVSKSVGDTVRGQTQATSLRESLSEDADAAIKPLFEALPAECKPA